MAVGDERDRRRNSQKDRLMATYEIDGGTYELPDDITPEQLNNVVKEITGRPTGQRQFERRSFEDILGSVRKSAQDEGFDYETGAGRHSCACFIW